MAEGKIFVGRKAELEQFYIKTFRT